jgi:chromosome partitioning protein
MILLCGAEKGGVGKSTIAVNMAAQASSKGRDVLLVDADKQLSSSMWAALRKGLNDDQLPKVTTVQLTGKGLHQEIKTLAPKFSDIVIDAGGRDSVELRAALLVADVLLVPVRPSQFDLWSLSTIDRLVNEARVINPEIAVFVVLNFASTNPSVKEAEEAREFIEGEFPDMTLIRTTLSERIAYRRASGAGKSVPEFEAASYAAHEIRQLYKELFK